jgi:hypothetical protein
MVRSFSQFVFPVALLVVAASSLSGFAQAGNPGTPGTGQTEDLHGLKVEVVRATPTPTPFPLDARTATIQALEFRSPEQMTEADRVLAEANQDEIARRAGLQGFRLGESRVSSADGWGYEQAVCPAFPDHLLLEYSRRNGVGDVTLFSAVVPRGEGHVRVIPVERRSYSLFTPVSKNSLTLHDFNYMVKEERAGLSPNWLTLGLCYAAMAGGHVRAGLIPSDVTEEHYPLSIPAKLTVSWKGGAEVRYADLTPNIKPVEWVFNFAQDGRLIKVHHADSSELIERPVVGQAVEVKGVPVKESTVDLK